MLVDENGVPLPEKTIIFEIGDQSTSAVTDENGLASTTLTLEQAAGRYYFVDAYFGGDEEDADPITELCGGSIVIHED